MLKKLSPIFLIVFCGCLSMGEKEKTQNISAPISIEASKEKAIASGVFAEGFWPNQDWWQDFGSPVLNELIEKALVQNPSLQAIESRIEQARQRSNVSKSKLFPTLFFNADDNWRYLSKNGFTHLLNPNLGLGGYQADLSLSFQYEFDFWGKYRNLFYASLGEVRAKEAELSDAKLILASSLAQSYFAFLITCKKKDLYENLCAVRKHRLDLQNHMVFGGLSSRIPPLEDDEIFKEAEQNLLSIQDDIETEKHLINILAGESPDNEVITDALLETPLLAIPIPEYHSVELLSRRPDLIAQIWQVEALAYQVSAAKADFFPNVNIAAFAGLSSILFTNLFKPTSQTMGIDPALTLPIFTGGSIRANLKAKKAQFDEAVFTYNNLLLGSVQEVADLLVHLQTAFEQKKLQEIALENAEDKLLLIQLRQKGGLDSEFTSLDSQEQVIFQKIKDLSILYNQYAFTIKLIKALGGGYQVSSPMEKQS